MDVISFRQATTPLVVSIPYCGVHVPAGIEAGLLDLWERAEGFSRVLNGRFTGGYITRHHGRPGAARPRIAALRNACMGG
ncbi:MAG: hypothetical protein IIA73_09110 [Proteobacteria bacterium]|nr:hypothetical protein [Pseudomonadota bacterium]